MGAIVIILILALAVWNAVRTMGRQRERMKNQICTGDCKVCKNPCEVKRIYHMDGSNKS